MAGTQLEPGWYQDPAGRSDLRWWDGTRWTTATRGKDDHPTGPITPVAPPTGPTAQRDTTTQWSRQQAPSPHGLAPPAAGSSAAADRDTGPSEGSRPSRMGRAAALIVAGLALVGVGATVAILLGPGDGASDQPTAHTSAATSDPATDDPSGTSDVRRSEDEVLTDDLLEDDPAAGSGDVDASDDADLPEEEDTTFDPPITIDFDGQCQVTVPLTQAQEEQLRAWDFPECTGAPVTLSGAQERWIVVVSSLNGNDFTESEALQRAAREGGDGVLWSSHYPSLNPNLWVVFDGPYNDESSARDAANRRGEGAYQRVLSDDEGDRYCLAADGCIGERGR